jgi:hypothetical protein
VSSPHSRQFRSVVFPTPIRLATSSRCLGVRFLEHSVPFFILLATVFGILITAPGYAHHAPKGWEYDYDCCSDRDCTHVPMEAIEEVSGGWIIRASGVFVKQSSTTFPKQKWSKDQDFHVCTGEDLKGHKAGDPASTRVFCLYVPQPGF